MSLDLPSGALQRHPEAAGLIFGRGDQPGDGELTHHTDGFCWCFPRVEYGRFGSRLVIHRQTVDSPWSRPRDEVWG